MLPVSLVAFQIIGCEFLMKPERCGVRFSEHADNRDAFCPGGRGPPPSSRTSSARAILGASSEPPTTNDECLEPPADCDTTDRRLQIKKEALPTRNEHLHKVM